MGRPVAPRKVNDVSNHVCHTSYCDFSWQACVTRHATHMQHDMQHDTQHAGNVGKTQGFFVFACRVACVLHVCCMSRYMASVYLATATPTTTASSHGVQLQTRVRFAICRAQWVGFRSACPTVQMSQAFRTIGAMAAASLSSLLPLVSSL